MIRIKNIRIIVLFFLIFLELSCMVRPYTNKPTIYNQKELKAKDMYKANGALNPISRYGGQVLTASGMPKGRGYAYQWAKNLGTLIAYETFIRKYPIGADSDIIKKKIKSKYIPNDKNWHKAWILYSKIEQVEGAIYDPNEGFIILGKPRYGTLPPFLYDDFIAALECSVANDKVGVTMNRIFPARFNSPAKKSEFPMLYETSIDFYSKKLWNTHLAYILFEGDRMLKTLSHGYDIFLQEPVICKVPGFETMIDMESREPIIEDKGNGRTDYGRTWIELTSVKINTNNKKNVAMFSNVDLEIRAESKHEPNLIFAKHLSDNYKAFCNEFPIFGEVERAARIVAIARWLAKTFPEVAKNIIENSYECVEIPIEPVISARIDITHETPTYKSMLIGGVIFPYINDVKLNTKAKIADTNIDDIQRKVINAKNEYNSWTVSLGRKIKDKYIAWRVRRLTNLKNDERIKENQAGKLYSNKIND